MQEYVVGFAFTPGYKEVLLVKKLRPEWQKGCLNGIGGKVEDGESYRKAMNRECLEETALELDWEQVGAMYGINNDGKDFVCAIFKAVSDNVYFRHQVEDELLKLIKPEDVIKLPHIANLAYLIPICTTEEERRFITIEYREA